MGGMRGYSPEESRRLLATGFKGLFWFALATAVAIGVVQMFTSY